MTKETFTTIGQTLGNFRDRVASPEGRRDMYMHAEDTIRRSKIGGMALDSGRMLADYFRDAEEPIGPKLMFGAAVIFLAIPTHLIPGWLLLISFADNLAALAFILAQLKEILVNYPERRRQRLFAA